jgi:hypothetical protein
MRHNHSGRRTTGTVIVRLTFTPQQRLALARNGHAESRLSDLGQVATMAGCRKWVEKIVRSTLETIESEEE